MGSSRTRSSEADPKRSSERKSSTTSRSKDPSKKSKSSKSATQKSTLKDVPSASKTSSRRTKQVLVDEDVVSPVVSSSKSTFTKMYEVVMLFWLQRKLSGWGTVLLLTLIGFFVVDLIVASRSHQSVPQNPDPVITGDASAQQLVPNAAQVGSQNIPESVPAQAVLAVSGNTDSQKAADNSVTLSVNTDSGNGAPADPNTYVHPMNRNVERLMLGTGLGSYSVDQVKEAYRRLAMSYLHPFKGGIQRESFFTILNRKNYGVTPDGANKGTQSILFQIIGGKVYMFDPYNVPQTSKDFYRARINEMIWLLSKLVSENRIYDTEFLVSIHDCIQTAATKHDYRAAKYVESNPVFTIVACNFSDNIPFPMWEGDLLRGGGYSTWDQKMKSYAQDFLPWAQKIPKAVFRGGNRPSMAFGDKSEADLHCDENGRSRLLYLSRVYNDLFDVSIGGKCGHQRYTLRRMTPDEHHRYKYVLYAEGNCFWADRLNRQLFGPSAVVKQETPCGQFYEPLLRPFVHYIPTDFAFTDTVERLNWARDKDGVVQGIVRNANDFATSFLSLSGIEAYVEVLLYEYTSLLFTRNIQLEKGAVDVTNKRV
eukprot:CAMPEP_0182446552 /NCGR_PEP_ID=MMETSP1172-20130603/4279_1 /TAXON_ID=708627 /ORGANISM="Timspurckia oligopyrenoides, Strain CCMP3278" /LENGTH=593 /DNA_ID=CAMNT_0024642503 /DNA_START=97 /DNA_END=1881 /DNA_ORIENTATION=-